MPAAINNIKEGGKIWNLPPENKLQIAPSPVHIPPEGGYLSKHWKITQASPVLLKDNDILAFLPCMLSKRLLSLLS